MALAAARGKLIGVIGDEVSNACFDVGHALSSCLMQDTCVGFLLGGIGELNKNRQPNFMVVDKSNCAYTKGGVSWLHRYLIFLSFRHALVRH